MGYVWLPGSIKTERQRKLFESLRAAATRKLASSSRGKRWTDLVLELERWSTIQGVSLLAKVSQLRGRREHQIRGTQVVLQGRRSSGTIAVPSPSSETSMNGLSAPAGGAAKPKPMLIRTLVLGDSSVGKTSLLMRYAKRGFNLRFTTTIGIDYSNYILELDGRQVTLQVSVLRSCQGNGVLCFPSNLLQRCSRTLFEVDVESL